MDVTFGDISKIAGHDRESFRNLEAIQSAAHEIPRDRRKISVGESTSTYEYDWPLPKIAV